MNAYLDSLTDSRVATIEYILISGVNDHRQHARELAEILKETPCKINLIPFNPFAGSDYNRSSDSAISNFRKILQEAGYIVTVRTTRGDEIGAACGAIGWGRLMILLVGVRGTWLLKNKNRQKAMRFRV